MVGFELVRLEPVVTWRLETESVMVLQVLVLCVVRSALVHQQPLEQLLFWGAEGFQCQQELGLSEGVARREQVALTG